MNIDAYLAQHEEAMELVQKLLQKLPNADKDAAEVSQILVQLIGKLKFHFSMEDKFLYPKAGGSANQKLQDVSKKMQADMVPITAALESYAAAWLSPDRIRANPAQFNTQTQGIIQALKKRMEAEEREFYPLAAQVL